LAEISYKDCRATVWQHFFECCNKEMSPQWGFYSKLISLLYQTVATLWLLKTANL